MHRQTDYPYQVPYETDFLYAQRFAYEGLGLLMMDALGTGTLVAGLACTATGPASMSVNIGPGRIYSKQNLDDSAWGQLGGVGGLAADVAADHQIIKQGIFRDTTALAAMAAPVSVGQSINYLVQAAFSEVDAIPTSLPFVNATAPYTPVAPQTLNTVRQDKCVVTVKAGTAATTGSQTTPAVDANNVGLWVVTVPYGATSITGTNISAYGSAPFLTETLVQKISQAFADARYLTQANAATTYQPKQPSVSVVTNNSGTNVTVESRTAAMYFFYGDDGASGTITGTIAFYQFSTTITPTILSQQGSPGTLAFVTSGTTLRVSRTGGSASMTINFLRLAG